MILLSQGGVKVPTGGKHSIANEARERFTSREGQQIRCNSGADG